MCGSRGRSRAAWREAVLTRRPHQTAAGALLIAAIAAGIAGRLVFVGRSFDYRQLAAWREADYVQIARNFDREGLNILYPRIDWRRDTPGYAEMELPLIPWIGALLYRLFGRHEFLLRVPSTVLGILSLVVFTRLAKRVLPPDGALIATAAFALSPLLIFLANAMQPDPLMVFLSLLAVNRIWAWEDEPRPSHLIAASLATAGAILAKSPAACLGLVFADAVIRTRGTAAFRRLETYLAALLALLPPAAWYAWANRFWRTYGNSLGLSNESHYLWVDMLWPPRFLYGIALHETVAVFSPAGLILAAVAFWRWGPGMRRIVPWAAATMAFYLVTARTSGDRWSFYYHALSVAPAALLVGSGASSLCTPKDGAGNAAAARRRRWGGLLAGVTLLGLAVGSLALIYKRDVKPDWKGMQECARQFGPLVPAGETIVVRGGQMFDEYGWPAAHNESMLFAWMDRKGFNYGDEELSIPTLDRIAARGGRFWIAAEKELDLHGLRAEATARFRHVAACESGYELFDLREGPGATEPPAPAGATPPG